MLLHCNLMWHTPAMPTNDPVEAAYAELDKLSDTFTSAEAARDRARESLHEAIVRHLRARSAPPGKLSDHTPYDRNYVGALGKAAGVRPLRGPNAAPPPVYVPAEMDRAYAELDKCSAAFEEARGAYEKSRDRLHQAIGRHSARLATGRLAEHTPYDRNHVMRIIAEYRAERTGAQE